MMNLAQEAVPFPVSRIPAANVASVPQRSPLRYPGGKTWLIPHIREWLGNRQARPQLLVEPFAGGATVSLTAVMESLVERSLMVELDTDIAAFWCAALNAPEELTDLVRSFEPTRSRIQAVELECEESESALVHGFRTLVLNRTRRGGILAQGAALTKNGENGQGVSSRWYPATLEKRLQAISAVSERIEFHHGDGLRTLENLLESSREETVYFIDPPYTARGGKRAGSRLYNHNELDHGQLFAVLANSNADFLMTYDCSEEIMSLVRSHGFSAAVVMMKNGHHACIPELIITREDMFS